MQSDRFAFLTFGEGTRVDSSRPRTTHGPRSWLGYLWAAPATMAGLLLAATAWRRGTVTVVDGIVEAHGPFIRWALGCLIPLPGGAAAITLGHVVLGLDATALENTRAHEHAHVVQYERWGPLFVPAYLTASVLAAAKGGHFYFDNIFEVEAFLAEGRRLGPRLRR